MLFILISNLINVFRGQTLKEKVVIEREVKDEKQKNQMFNLSWKQKLGNLKEFCLRKQIQSEILEIF